ncbi:MAG: hypothetical protein QME96_01270 [Myxococcota bacterium]|nr:hypothetical protein [Myxococcota bacterium]
MKNTAPACGPKGGAMRPLSCHGSDLEFDRGPRPAADFQECLNRWRIEHIERDWSFRVRVLRAAGLMK